MSHLLSTKNLIPRIGILLLAGVGIFFFAGSAFAGPITGGPGNAPFTKLGVYQGVIAVIPGGGTDSVMEIGNAGRDIASTGDLYLRPQSGSVTTQANYIRLYHSGGGQAGLSVPGSLCLEGTCLNVWADICNYISCGGGPGGTPTLDQVLAVGNSGNNKVILLNNQAIANQSFGASSGAGVGSGSFAFVTPYLGNGSYSDVTKANDSGLIFSSGTGLTLSGWNTAGTIKGARVTGGSVTNAALAVNNGLAGQGSSGDALASFANSANSAIYGQQNGGGYAGAFSGRFIAYQSGVSDPPTGWTGSSILRAKNSSSAGSGGYTLQVYNADATGYAGGFSGVVQVFGKGGNFPGGATAALEGRSTASVANDYGVGVYGQGGLVFSSGILGSIGVFGQGRTTTAGGQFSYGVYGGYAIGGGPVGSCGAGNCYSVYGEGSSALAGTTKTYAIYGKAGGEANGGIAYAGFFEGGDVVITKIAGSTTGFDVVTYKTSLVTSSGNDTCHEVCASNGQLCALEMDNNNLAPPNTDPDTMVNNVRYSTNCNDARGVGSYVFCLCH